MGEVVIKISRDNSIYLTRETRDSYVREPVIEVREWDDAPNNKHKIEIVTRSRTYEIHFELIGHDGLYDTGTTRIYFRGRSPLELWRVFEEFTVDIIPSETIPYLECDHYNYERIYR